MSSKKTTSYFYDEDYSVFNFGPSHPLKPFRSKAVHTLICSYELDKYMNVYKPMPATKNALMAYHSKELINFLEIVTPHNVGKYISQFTKFFADDTPVFEGMFQFARISAGASLSGSVHINTGLCDYAINFLGAMQCSGFCLLNDCVLGIIELLKFNQRVLYLDIDIHHGDGVQEAFYLTDRVMSISFHMYGRYFPCTGAMTELGEMAGKYYSVNVPLLEGLEDDEFIHLYQTIVQEAVDFYQPSVIVLQSGADSLQGDRLGLWNISIQAHASCVEFLKKFQISILLLGGGGYTISNVVRTWTLETSILLDKPISNDIPPNEYFKLFKPDFKLVPPKIKSKQSNNNSKEYIANILEYVRGNLRKLAFVPSVPFSDIPDAFSDGEVPTKKKTSARDD